MIAAREGGVSPVSNVVHEFKSLGRYIRDKGYI